LRAFGCFPGSHDIVPGKFANWQVSRWQDNAGDSSPFAGSGVFIHLFALDVGLADDLRPFHFGLPDLPLRVSVARRKLSSYDRQKPGECV
jgi:hypothetical protein